MNKLDELGFWAATALGVAACVAAGILVWYTSNLPAPTP